MAVVALETSEQLSRALGEAIVRIWGRLPPNLQNRLFEEAVTSRLAYPLNTPSALDVISRDDRDASRGTHEHGGARHDARPPWRCDIPDRSEPPSYACTP
jgi:hypothetical protein